MHAPACVRVGCVGALVRARVLLPTTHPPTYPRSFPPLPLPSYLQGLPLISSAVDDDPEIFRAFHPESPHLLEDPRRMDYMRSLSPRNRE